MLLDTTAAIFDSTAAQLAQVFQLADEDRPSYRPEELGAILRHQLRTRVEFDLQALEPGIQRLLRAAAECGDETSRIRTFGDLFSRPEPPIQLLYLTKKFAKQHLKHPESPLPPEIATVLYYGSIVAALVRWDRHITWLTDEELSAGLDLVLAQPWLTEDLRVLFRTARARFPESAPSLAGSPPP